MALLCMLYFVVVGAGVGVAGLLAERALPAGAPRRWVWCAALALSAVLPPLTSARHPSSVIAVWGQPIARLPLAASAGAWRRWLDCDTPLAATFLRGYLLATVALFAWGAVGAWRVSRLVRGSRAAVGRGRRARPSVVDGVPVVVSDSLGPATVGVWRPRVVVPRWVLALPRAQRRYVVRHEAEHRRARDAALLAAASVLACLFPWNLPLWWQLRRLRLAVELDCDRRVVATLGDATAYGALLLRVAEAASRARAPRLQPAFLGGAGMLERRLTALVAPAPRRAAQWLLAAALTGAVLSAVLSMPHPMPDRGAAGHAMGR